MNKRVYWVISLLVFFVGCKTIDKVSSGYDIPLLEKKEIFKRLSVNSEKESLNNVLFKRASVVINSETFKQNFKCNIALKRDSFLRVSVLGPIGIEVLRISFEPDFIKIIDRINREVIFAHYSELYTRYGVSVDFQFLQKIILNEPYSYFTSDVLGLFDFEYCGVENSLYKFSSVKEKKLNRKLNFHNLEDLAYQQFWIHPNEFHMVRNFIELSDSQIKLNISYKDFKKRNTDFYFPFAFEIEGSLRNKIYNFRLSFTDIQFNASNLIGFSIPKKYVKVYR